MTQKELLYVEDAIEHETSIITICEDAITKLDNDDFIAFMNNEIANHQLIKSNLMELLRGQSNG